MSPPRPAPSGRCAGPRLGAFARDERGATAIEYGLLVASLALFIITAVTAVGTNVGGVMNKVANALH